MSSPTSKRYGELRLQPRLTQDSPICAVPNTLNYREAGLQPILSYEERRFEDSQMVYTFLDFTTRSALTL